MRLPFLLVLPLALAACSLAPEYTRPPMDVPAAYKEDGAWKPAAAALPDPGKWWQAFGDPLLDRLEEALIVDNQNLKIAEAQYRAARAAVDAARAGLFPTLGLSAAASRGSTGSGSSTGGSRGITDLYSLSGQAAWEVDLWGRIRNGVDAAGAKAEASAGTLGAARLSAQALLAQTYFQLRAAEAQTELLNRTVTAYQRFVELTRNRQAAGLVSALDVAQAETLLNGALTQLADARLSRAQNEHAIAVLVGRPPAALALPAGSGLPAVPGAPALIPSATLESRWDIYSAERQVAAANAQIGVARAAWFPVLDIAANGGFRNTVLSNLITTPARFWSLGPTLALTLFDAGARSAALTQAEAGYDQAAAAYRQTVLTAFQEVEDNLVAAHLLMDESVSQQAALAAARRAREIAENQYRAGTAASLNVIVAQAAELSAENNAIAIWNRRMAAAVQLYKNIGGRPLADRQAAE
ncbi:MAG: transporter [Rhodocyclaceae bacterium]|nr:transporter [Rhodocyclaceae bacterium]